MHSCCVRAFVIIKNYLLPLDLCSLKVSNEMINPMGYVDTVEKKIEIDSLQPESMLKPEVLHNLGKCF